MHVKYQHLLEYAFPITSLLLRVAKSDVDFRASLAAHDSRVTENNTENLKGIL